MVKNVLFFLAMLSGRELNISRKRVIQISPFRNVYNDLVKKIMSIYKFPIYGFLPLLFQHF